MSRWNDKIYTDADLAEILSDYHKDVHGTRLRMFGECRAALVRQLDYLDAYMEKMRSTPEGCAQLAEEGWVV